MSQCLLCSSPTTPIISFGPMPLANGFLTQTQFESEAFFELDVGFCVHCSMMQLADPVPEEVMFHTAYPFYTSSSSLMSAHFRRLAADVIRHLPPGRDAFVVEIGSNDGTLLHPFSSSGIRHLGVEPSRNVAEAARYKGIETLCRFFDDRLADEIVAAHGHANVVLAANCFCHIRDLHSLGRGIRALLKPEGRLIFEDPYLGDILRLNSYDQIYDEHIYYFSLASVTSWLSEHGLEVVDVERQHVHGGSMRYTAGLQGALPVAPSIARLRLEEANAGLLNVETIQPFRNRVERSRDQLMTLLHSLQRDGRRVAGYGATSKSTTVLNYCGINSSLVEFIADTTPIKQGKFSPGAHIPVQPHATFTSRYPDHALLFAWNHSAEIFAKEDAFRKAGGKWITYVPEVAVS